jgi:hypothetical protein
VERQDACLAHILPLANCIRNARFVIPQLPPPAPDPLQTAGPFGAFGLARDALEAHRRRAMLLLAIQLSMHRFSTPSNRHQWG